MTVAVFTSIVSSIVSRISVKCLFGSLVAGVLAAKFCSSHALADAPSKVLAVPLQQIHTTKQTVRFCGSDHCAGKAYADELEIVADDAAGAQVVGVWIVPSNRSAAAWLDQFHALAFPDPNKGDSVIVQFMHATANIADVLEYTLVITYVKPA